MKKGFTLIELLAVILVLAFISIITVPIVLDLIDDSRKKASENSINVYIKSVNNKIAENRVNKLEIEDGVYNILSSGNICLVYDSSTCVSELKLSLTNSYPTSGEIEIKDGKVYNYDLYIDGKEYKKN